MVQHKGVMVTGFMFPGGRRVIIPGDTPPPVTPDFGPFLNDWIYDVANSRPRTTGVGGDYPTGDAYLPTRTYVVNPFDLSQVGRTFDNTKPRNNWITFHEKDGPNTTSVDLRPESAAVLLGQTQTQAYNDTTHGGGFRAINTGSFRLCFDGFITWQLGGFHLNTGQDRLIFHRNLRNFSIGEWRRQYDIVAALRGLNTVGASLPDDSGSGGPFSQVWSDPRMKGNTVNHFNFTCGWRLEGGSRIYVLACDVGPVGDDGMFSGNGSDHIYCIGTVFHEHDNQHSSYNGPFLTMGPLVTNLMHNDAWQATGEATDIRCLDCTLQGHGLEWVTDNGDFSDMIADRVWHGVTGGAGGDIGVGNANGNIPATVKIGVGAPTTRVGSGHFYRSFSIGTSFNDGDPQSAYAISGAGATFHTGLIGYTNAKFNPTIGTTTVQVPAGCAVDVHGFITPNTITQWLASTDAPHNAFKAQYAATDLIAIMTDYGGSSTAWFD